MTDRRASEGCGARHVAFFVRGVGIGERGRGACAVSLGGSRHACGMAIDSERSVAGTMGKLPGALCAGVAARGGLEMTASLTGASE